MTSNSEAVAVDILGKRGLTLSEAGKRAVLEHLDQNLRISHDETHSPVVTVVTEAGGEITPYEFFDDWLAANPDHIANLKTTSTWMSKAPATMTERMTATIAGQKVDRAGEATAIAKAGNPWLPSNRNMTRQGLISKLDPILAEKLKAESRNV